jgi:hypothetical protein
MGKTPEIPVDDHGRKIYRPNGMELHRFLFDNSPVAIIQGPVGCLDAHTEFLTPHGWKRIADYQPGDAIAEWDHASGKIAWALPREFVNLPCTEFWRFSNRHSLSMVLSDEHRVPVYTTLGRFKVMRADALAAAPGRHMVPVSFAAPDGGGLPLSDEEIRLFIAIAADGCLPKRGNQIVICVRKARKKARLRWLLRNAGVTWKEHQHSTRPSELTFAICREGWNKGFGSAPWYGASRRQLEIVLDELPHWDGLCDGSDERFATTVREQADFVQYAAHATGRRATISVKDDARNEGWATLYTVYITRPGSRKSRVAVRGDHTAIERVASPDGRKYCFVTGTGFFVARRDGRIFITGNSGSSSASCQRIWRHALEQNKGPDGLRRSRWLIVRDSFPNLKSTTVKTWLDWFPENVYGRFYWDRPFRHDFRVNDIRLEVLFMSLDSEEDIKKCRSLELTGAWINELEFTPKYLFDEILSRCGRFPAVKDGGSKWSGVIADMNAPPDDHWVPLMRGDIPIPEWMSEDEAQGYEKPEDWRFFIQPPGLIEIKNAQGNVTGYRTNPDAENLLWLEDYFYEKLAKGKTKSWVDSRILNKIGIIVDGQPVWTMFDEHMHVAPGAIEAVPGIPIVVGLDFGRTPAAMFCQNVRGRWHFLRELVAQEMSAVSFAPIVRKEMDTRFPSHEFVVYGDPSGGRPGQETEQTCYDIFRANGIVVYPAPGNHNDETVRINAMESALNRMVDGKPAVAISAACRTFKTGMRGGFHYKKLKVAGEARYAMKPDKNRYSHICEAACYALLGGGEGREMVKRPEGGAPPKVNVRKRYVRGKRGRAA